MADANFAKLEALRATYDPTHMFASYLINPVFSLNT